MTELKQYVGDGIYIDAGSHLGEIVLTTEDGVSVQNRIVIGDWEWRTMLRLREQQIEKIIVARRQEAKQEARQTCPECGGRDRAPAEGECPTCSERMRDEATP